MLVVRGAYIRGLIFGGLYSGVFYGMPISVFRHPLLKADVCFVSSNFPDSHV